MLLIPVVNLEHIKVLPSTPFITRGCEGECCSNITSNKILKDAPLFQYPDLSSKKVGVLKKDELFDLKKSEMYIRTNQYGSALFGGKKLTVYGAGEEGSVLGFDGKTISEFGGGSDECIACENSTYSYVAPKTEAWMKIFYGKNNFGWLKNDYAAFITPGACN